VLLGADASPHAVDSALHAGGKRQPSSGSVGATHEHVGQFGSANSTPIQLVQGMPFNGWGGGASPSIQTYDGNGLNPPPPTEVHGHGQTAACGPPSSAPASTSPSFSVPASASAPASAPPMHAGWSRGVSSSQQSKSFVIVLKQRLARTISPSSSHPASAATSEMRHPTVAIERNIISTLSDEFGWRQTIRRLRQTRPGTPPNLHACITLEQRASSARMTRISAFTSVAPSRNVMRLWFVGVLHAVTLHTTNTVHADEVTWRLEYHRSADAPSNCPDENDLRTALSAKIAARDPFSNDAFRKIKIDVTRTTGRIEARIQAHDEQGNVVSESTAHAPSWRCDQLATRIVFVLRDIVDPLNQATPTSSPSAPSPPLASSLPSVKDGQVDGSIPRRPMNPVIAKQPAVAADESKRPPSWSKPQIALSLGFGATWWNMPNTAFSSAFGVGLNWHAFSVGIQARYDYAWTLPLDKPVRAAQAAMAAVVCGHHGIRDRRILLRACLLGELGRMWINSDQYRAIDYASTLGNLGIRLGVGAALNQSWSIELHADGIYATHRPNIAFNSEERWRLPLFNGAIRANLVGLFDVF